MIYIYSTQKVKLIATWQAHQDTPIYGSRIGGSSSKSKVGTFWNMIIDFEITSDSKRPLLGPTFWSGFEALYP